MIVAYINKQGGTYFHTFVMAGSGFVSMATNSRYSHPSQTLSRLSKRDSGLPISAEPAHNNRVESPPRNNEPNLWDMGTSTVDMFATVHNTHLQRLCLQFWSLEYQR